MRRERKHQRSVSKKPTIKKRVSKSNTNQQPLKRIIYIASMCVFIALIACIGIGTGMYAAVTSEIQEMNMHELSLARSSIVYYTDEFGNSEEAAALYSNGNSIWVESSQISDVMKDAIISIEDERFYSHSGIDIKRTLGAFFGYVREKFGGAYASYGGSTITQQVIKNITSEKDRTATRKIKEIMRAVALEKELSKDEILTIYLNVIFLANNCYGVESASNVYFNKSASELNLTEAALIAGITQRPSYYDPIRNPENAKTKRNLVLEKMYELKKISKEEYEEAVSSDLGISQSHIRYNRSVYSYFVDTVINEVINDLQTEKGYTEAFATQQVFSGGLKIYTTMDMNIQEKMEEVFEDESRFSGGAKNAQAAMVIVDPGSGAIKGIIGGKGEKTDSRGLNRATQTRRQPGSSIKPLSVYSPAIEEKLITMNTILNDEPITIKNWSPKNSYSGFKGNMTVKTAVSISANIPAIKVLQKVGVGTSFDYVKNKFHLGVADADRDLSPLALGGLTNGVTVREMAAAYQAFANGGYYNTPHTYTKVLDSTNKVLLEKKVYQNKCVSSDTAYIMSELLYGVVNSSSGTGKQAKLRKNIEVCGKTGTTNNNYDKWFVGFTPYYVGAVWFGFDTQTSLSSKGISQTVAVRLWRDVMEKVHENLDSARFKRTENVVEANICSQTGLLATEGCEGTSAYFEKGTVPRKYCSGIHQGDEETIETPEEGDTQTTDEQTQGDPADPSADQQETTDEQTQTDIEPITPETQRPIQGEVVQTDDEAISLE